MDIQTPSSFIPKKSMVPGGAFSRSGSLLSFVANLIFVITVVVSLGVFVYQKYLEGQISRMNDNLSATRVALQPDLIKELARSDARIISAQELLNKHTTLSAFFELLQTLTLQNLRFTNFSYTENNTGVLTITMKGQARTYATVALQASIFSNNENFINPQFSNLDLDDKGNVIFTFQSQLNPRAVSYKEHFRGAATGSAIPSSPTTNVPSKVPGSTAPTP